LSVERFTRIVLGLRVRMRHQPATIIAVERSVRASMPAWRLLLKATTALASPEYLNRSSANITG
jgi:hypothetical protein